MLIGAGCSLTYGSELESVGTIFHNDPQQSFKKTFIAKIANKLNKDYTIVAVPGASNKSIARSVLPYLYKQDVTEIIVCWTWMERINISDVCVSPMPYELYLAGKYKGPVTPAMWEVYGNNQIGFENQIESLEAYYLVNSTAIANNKKVYNVNMGSCLDAIIPYDNKTLPNDHWIDSGGSNLSNHPYWHIIDSCNNLFDSQALHYTIPVEVKTEIGHFTEHGHIVCADMILTEMEKCQ